MKALAAVVCGLCCAVAVAGELERARTLMQEGKLDEAEAVLLTTVNDPAQKGESLTLLARLYTRQGEWDTAVDYGKQATKALPSKSAAYWRLGNAHEQLSERDKAKTAYRKALSLDPKNDEAKKALKALS